MASEISLSMQSQGKSESTQNLTTHGLLNAEGFDIFLPLIEQTGRRKPKLSILSDLIKIYCCLQFVWTSFWPLSTAYANPSTTDTQRDNLSILLSIVYFFQYPTESGLLIMFIVVLALTLICFVWIIVIMGIYIRNHQFMDWTLDVCQFMFESIFPLLILPCAICTQFSFYYLINQGILLYWVFVIVSLICYTINVFIYSKIYIVQCKGAYIAKTLFGSFDPNPVLFCYLSSICPMLYGLLMTFPDYFKILVYIIHIVIFLGVLYFVTSLPFHKLASSVLIASIATASVVSDILFIIFSYIDLPIYIPFIVTGVVFAVMLIVYTFVFGAQTRKIVDLMNFQDEDGIDYDKFEFNKSKRKLLMYARIAFQNHCDSVVNSGELFSYIIRTENRKEVLIPIAQLVCFFPVEVRYMNFLSSEIFKFKLSSNERAVMYEITRIKILRQSSASSIANEQRNELKSVTASTRAIINGFWSLTSPSLVYCETIGNRIKQEKGIFETALMNFPNNANLAEEYAIYLAECPVDIDESLKNQRRNELICQGKDFILDRCFRSFIAAYPEYFMKKVLTLNGRYIRDKKTRKSSQSTNSSGNMSFGSASNSSILNLDADMEEQLSRQTLTYHKLRLTLFRSLDGRSSSIIRSLPITVGCFCLIIIAIFMFVYFYSVQSMQEPRDSLVRLISYTWNRFLINLATTDLFLSFGKNTQRISNLDIIGDPISSESYIDLYGDLSAASATYLLEAETNLRTFLDQLQHEAEQGTNVYTLASVILSNSVEYSFCIDGEAKPYTSNLKDLSVHAYYTINSLAYNTEFNEWFTSNNEFCELIKCIQPLSSSSNTLFQNLISEQENSTSSYTQILEYLLYIFTPLLFILTFVPGFVYIILYTVDVRNVQKLLLSIDAESKTNATQYIRKGAKTADANAAKPSSCSILVVFSFVLFFFGVVQLLMGYFSISLVVEAAQHCNDFSIWMTYASTRITSSEEALFYTLLSVFLADPSIPQDFANLSRAMQYAETAATTFDDAHNNMLLGSGTTPSYGYDSEFDSINLDQQCEMAADDTDFREYYRCASLAQALSILKNIITEVISDPSTVNGQIADQNTLGGIQIMSDIIIPKSLASINRLQELNENSYNDTKNTVMIMMIVAIIISLLIFFVSFVAQNIMQSTFSVLFILIRHMKPMDIINNQDLLSYLLNRRLSTAHGNMSISQSVIHNSVDGVMLASINGIIESVNPAVSVLLGYTPDQMLGQPAQTFFSEEDAQKVLQQITLMKNGQSSTTYKENYTLINDTKDAVPCAVSIIGMTSDSVQNNIQSFVFLMRDETELQKAKKEAERAKQQSETLLYQILPKDIVIRLNQGEKNISFSVPSASIIFIDIVRFSEYAANLTPSQILGTLSLIFAEFDTIIAKYQLLIKIKLIGDVYMAAGGLFMKEDNPTLHAEQMVQFACEALGAIDDANTQLSSNLAVRIGVNTGGPIIAGVLGTDKPAFDIIGDPINVASRLQSTSLPGRIQISQATKDLISGLNGLEIELRNEVFLKGKGKTQAYFVSPFFSMSALSSTLKGLE